VLASGWQGPSVVAKAHVQVHVHRQAQIQARIDTRAKLSDDASGHTQNSEAADTRPRRRRRCTITADTQMDHGGGADTTTAGPRIHNHGGRVDGSRRGRRHTTTAGPRIHNHGEGAGTRLRRRRRCATTAEVWMDHGDRADTRRGRRCTITTGRRYTAMVDARVNHGGDADARPRRTRRWTTTTAQMHDEGADTRSQRARKYTITTDARMDRDDRAGRSRWPRRYTITARGADKLRRGRKCTTMTEAQSERVNKSRRERGCTITASAQVDYDGRADARSRRGRRYTR
jgi:hypothetical protein